MRLGTVPRSDTPLPVEAQPDRLDCLSRPERLNHTVGPLITIVDRSSGGLHRSDSQLDAQWIGFYLRLSIGCYLRSGHMLTIFTVPKPFVGHTAVIQRNALLSWKRLSPPCQIVLCGDELGSHDVASELHLDHLKDIRCNEFGTPLLSSVFSRAEECSMNRVLCYANTDLLMFQNIVDAARLVSANKERYLIVGETWNLDITKGLSSADIANGEYLRRSAEARKRVRGRLHIDYFMFPRGTIGPLPDFAVGRPAWDNWLIWRARSLRIPVVDVSPSAFVIHQEHGYEHVKQSTVAWEGPEADRNRRLLGFPERLFSLDDSTHRLNRAGLVPNRSGGVKRRIRTELTFRSWTIPLHRALQPLNDLLRRAHIAQHQRGCR